MRDSSPLSFRSSVSEERLFSLEFPERAGALDKFLTTLQPGVNITLFHYRNYGGDVGKVLTAIQCPREEDHKLAKFLKTLGYPYKEETDSGVYKTFLRSETQHVGPTA
jgi:threonine dehydratase